MNNLDKQYINLLKDILQNGDKKETRNGGTLSVFGRQIRHKMSDGFPLLTTKKMYTKGIITELIYFLRGETSIEFLVDNNCNIWNGDFSKHHNVNIDEYVGLTKEDCNLFEGGPIYPHQWRNYGSKNYNRKRITIPFKTFFNKTEPNFTNLNNEIGKIYVTKENGSYIIIDTTNKGVKNELHYKIQFLDTNTIKTIRRDKLNTNVFDPYKPSKCGVACVGEYNEILEYTDKVKNIWSGIISRCYNPKNDNYKYYGGKGVYVENRWLCFEYFLSDVTKIKNWKNKLKNWDEYDIDKDVYGDGYFYSLENCCWLLKSDNLRKAKEKYIYTVSNGFSEFTFKNHVDFILTYNISNQGNFSAMLRGERNICEGWYLIKKEKIKDGVDQIKDLINELKTNPDSRRLYVIAWNPTDLPNQALPACHLGFECYTRKLNLNERIKIAISNILMTPDQNLEWGHLVLDSLKVPRRALSLKWHQRSCDLFLGGPFNIASYGLLLEILAKECNMVADELIGDLGNTHLYLNHIEQAKEQMTRDGYELPKLDIKLHFEQEDSFKPEWWLPSDFEIIGYKSHPTIKAELSN